jgi:Ecdysteroid kinase-like family
MSFRIPLTPEEFDVTVLEKLIQTKYPDVRLDSIVLVDAALSSDGEERVSTAGRMAFDVLYSNDTGMNLPKRLMVKVARPEFVEIPLYENEVNLYTRLSDEIRVRMPRCFGGFRDHGSLSFGLVLEDLRVTDVRFENVLSKFRAEDTAALLEQLALLHAPYWESPRFSDDLGWVQPHTSGPIHDLFSLEKGGVHFLIEHEIATHQFKRELVESIGQSLRSLAGQVARVQRHQANLPCTLLHGDAHVGNTYRTKDGARGYLDFQLSARGFCMHDVSYTIVTSLSVKDRRLHELSLINGYRERLIDMGVQKPPTMEILFEEYRRAMAWNLYIGWLTSPTENYGWEITVGNLIRLATAYRDLDSANAIDELLE